MPHKAWGRRRQWLSLTCKVQLRRRRAAEKSPKASERLGASRRAVAKASLLLTPAATVIRNISKAPTANSGARQARNGHASRS
eukprot:8898177-Alexandrium_andersonii.AAC.1